MMDGADLQTTYAECTFGVEAPDLVIVPWDTWAWTYLEHMGLTGLEGLAELVRVIPLLTADAPEAAPAYYAWIRWKATA